MFKLCWEDRVLSVEGLALSVEMLAMREKLDEEALPFRQRSGLLASMEVWAFFSPPLPNAQTQWRSLQGLLHSSLTVGREDDCDDR